MNYFKLDYINTKNNCIILINIIIYDIIISLKSLGGEYMKTALVLSGGGARGAYEAGVIKALDELNIKCDIVTGVSIGSVNTACYAQKNTKILNDLWKNISYKSVFECNNIPKTKKELM